LEEQEQNSQASNGLCYFMPGRRDSRHRNNGIGINVITRYHWLRERQTSLEHRASISEKKSFIVGISITQCVINTPSY